MKKQLGGVVAILLAAAAAQAQFTPVFTRPAIPPREALDRLNLKLAWRAYVPTAGTRDGIYSFQMAGKHVLVQTRSGLIVALDRDTGATLWRNRVGVRPYDSLRPLGWNAKSVFVAHGTWLSAFDRDTGVVQWQYALPNAVAAAPAADDTQLYLSLAAGRFSVYLLPPESRRELLPAGEAANKNYLPKVVEPVVRPPEFHRGSRGTTAGHVGPLSSAIQASRGEATGTRPLFLRDFQAGTGLETAPLLTPREMVWSGANGTVMVMPKTPDIPIRPYRFPTDGPISVQPGQWGEYAYVGSHDGTLYALHIPSGRTVWRFPGGNPIRQKPVVTNEDVYVASEGSGLHRIDRITGQVVWRSPNAARFLAANPKFVYAADRSNRLLVLDRARGTQLSAYDATRDFNVPLYNEQTDRLFLAGHDGLLICLHDRDYGTPQALKDDEEKQFPREDKDKKPDEKPEPEKPDDKMPGKPDGQAMEKPGEKGEAMPKP